MSIIEPDLHRLSSVIIVMNSDLLISEMSASPKRRRLMGAKQVGTVVLLTVAMACSRGIVSERDPVQMPTNDHLYSAAIYVLQETIGCDSAKYVVYNIDPTTIDMWRRSGFNDPELSDSCAPEKIDVSIVSMVEDPTVQRDVLSHNVSLTNSIPRMCIDGWYAAKLYIYLANWQPLCLSSYHGVVCNLYWKEGSDRILVDSIVKLH